MGNIESHVVDDPSAHKAVTAMVDEYNRIIGGRGIANQTLREILYSYLASVVPLTLKKERVNDVEKLVIDHKKWKPLIEWPLGYFICGEDPDIELGRIKEMDSAPMFCGKVFEMGDPTYSCKYVATRIQFVFLVKLAMYRDTYIYTHFIKCVYMYVNSLFLDFQWSNCSSKSSLIVP